MPTLKQLVEMARFYKLNFLHLHLTDDQAFTFPSTRFPKVAAGSKYRYTLRELAEVRAYAELRAVTVIGEADVPGHATAITQADPDNFGFPSFPKTPIVNFVNATVIANLQSIFDEIQAALPSPYIAIGGDEVLTSLVHREPLLHVDLRLCS